MVEAVIKAEKRDGKGKGAAHTLRRQGLIPGVVYGLGRPSETVAVDGRELSRFLASESGATMFTLQVGKNGVPVLLKEVQRNPLTGDVLHVDFYMVNLNEPVHTVVPLHFVGEEKRVSDGGVVQHGLRQVEVKCLPAKIPEHIEVDLSGVKLGDSLTVADLKVDEGIEILTPAEDIVASVIAPTRAVAAEAEGEAAEGAAQEGAGGGAGGAGAAGKGGE